MSVGYHIVIPARLASERLPDKPLLEICGKPMIEHVYRRASESAAQTVVVATDSRRVRDTVKAFGGEAVMTSQRHQSGTDRIYECADRMGWPEDAAVVNLQGDEPLMPAACLDQAAGLLAQSKHADVATLCWPIDSAQEVKNSNVVKVVSDASGLALYFSRSVIPHPRNQGVPDALRDGSEWFRHIGLYAYSVRALRAFSRLAMSRLERLEKLEQLRFLEAGYRIALAQACCFIPAGVDTPEDLARVREQISARV